MSRLTKEFFAYIWAWYQLANRLGRSHRGRAGEKFSRAILKLAPAKYESAWPMKANRGHGEWAGCAWYRAAGLNKLVQGEEEHDPTAVSDPAKYLFAADKNLVRTTSAFLTHRDFVALERQQVSLYELLEREHISYRVEEQFGVDPRTLDYRGPVVVGWQHFVIPKKGAEKAGASKLARSRPPKRGLLTEKIYWLGILRRDILDLKETWVRRLLPAQPEGRALLLRGAFDLFLDVPNAGAVNPPSVTIDPRVAARALTLLQGGSFEQGENYDLARDVDLRDGRRSYLFLYEKKAQSSAAGILAKLTPDDCLVWWAAAATADAVREVMLGAKLYGGQMQILVFSQEMAATIVRQLPWTWHQKTTDLRTIHAATEDEGTAQIRMLVLASAFQMLFYSDLSLAHLRAAWMGFGNTADFQVTLDRLVHSGLLSIGGKDNGLIFGSGISYEAFMSDDTLVASLVGLIEWLWSAITLSATDRSWMLDSAVARMRQLTPEYGAELYERWRTDFPRDHYVLMDRMRVAIRNEDWSEMGEAVRRLVADGERDMIDVAMKHVFTGTLAEQHRVEALVRAAEATLETGRGTSYAVDTLLRDYERPEVAAFLRTALQQGSGNLYLVLRDLSDRDPKLAQFILDIAAALPMDDMTREQFDRASRRTHDGRRTLGPRRKGRRL
jgi:hypothetical protein